MHLALPSPFVGAGVSVAPLLPKLTKITKCGTQDFILAITSTSQMRRLSSDNVLRTILPPPQRLTDHWVARILEVRALNGQNVFARIFWMYWPDKLPVGTTDGRKSAKGRQSYHGEHELIASNHSQFCPAGCANCSVVANLN
jgi:hypothetical protein